MRLVGIIGATLLACVAHAQRSGVADVPQITGVYSSLSIHRETLDVLVQELIISKMSASTYAVILQCAEGQVSRPILADAILAKGFLTFTPSDHTCGNEFSVHILMSGLRLSIDGAKEQFLPRHHSFWETHQ